MVWFWCMKLFVIIKLCCCSLCKYRSNVDKIWQVPFCKVDLLFLRLKIVWQPVRRTLPTLLRMMKMMLLPRFLKTSAMSQVGFNPKLVNLSSVSMSTVTCSLRHIISELWFTTVGKCNLRRRSAGSNLYKNKNWIWFFFTSVSDFGILSSKSQNKICTKVLFIFWCSNPLVLLQIQNAFDKNSNIGEVEKY